MLIQLTGHLTADAKVKQTRSQKELVEFSIALNYAYKKSSGERAKKTTYVNCTYWRSTSIASHLKKGLAVQLSGFMEAGAYLKQGNPVGTIRFTVQSLEFIGASKKSSQPASTTTAPAAVTEPIDDLPF